MLGALIALGCVNQVHLHVDLMIQDLDEVERRIEAAELDDARELLDRQSPYVDSAALRMRIADLRGLLLLRAKRADEKRGWVLTHFRDRQRANKHDPRFVAWLAEASFAEGRQTEALALITELKNRDLMPDAYAYVVLAKLSIGKQREAALATCKTRAKAKSICVVPKSK